MQPVDLLCLAITAPPSDGLRDPHASLAGAPFLDS
ncbi:hypothetical protein RPHASCH2410_PC00775 (plasmid) [Rhizobium phaseoli Ch24-10]|nr:hypothetical protein RPHASCH2410_PC00775 [Rhizobium phaseoli Ch24-10]